MADLFEAMSTILFGTGYRRGEWVIVKTGERSTQVCQLHDQSELHPDFYVGTAYSERRNKFVSTWILKSRIIGKATEDRRFRKVLNLLQKQKNEQKGAA